MNIAKDQATAPVHFDEKTIRQSLNQVPFLLEHRLAGHSLFALPRLVATAPHWVRNGPAVSISFSITFHTSHSDRREILYRINHKMRTLGLHPRPVGRSPSSDNLKYAIFNAARSIVKAVRPNRAA